MRRGRPVDLPQDRRGGRVRREPRREDGAAEGEARDHDEHAEEADPRVEELGQDRGQGRCGSLSRHYQTVVLAGVPRKKKIMFTMQSF